MGFFDKTKEETEPVPEKEKLEKLYKVQLTITMEDGGEYKTWFRGVSESQLPKTPNLWFKDFYKWFFNRPQSKYYRLTTSKLDSVIFRDQIKRFQSEIKEEEL